MASPVERWQIPIPSFRGKEAEQNGPRVCLSKKPTLYPYYARECLIGFLEHDVLRLFWKATVSKQLRDGLEIRHLSKSPKFPPGAVISLMKNGIDLRSLSTLVIDAAGSAVASFQRTQGSEDEERSLEVTNYIPFYTVNQEGEIIERIDKTMVRNIPGNVLKSLTDIVYDPCFYTHPETLNEESPSVRIYSPIGFVSEGSGSLGEILSAPFYLVRDGDCSSEPEVQSATLPINPRPTGSPRSPRKQLANRATHRKSPSQEDIRAKEVKKNTLDQAPSTPSRKTGREVPVEDKQKSTDATVSRGTQTAPSLRQAADSQRDAPVEDKQKPTDVTASRGTQTAPSLRQAAHHHRGSSVGEKLTAPTAKVSQVARRTVSSQKPRGWRRTHSVTPKGHSSQSKTGRAARQALGRSRPLGASAQRARQKPVIKTKQLG